MFYNKSCRWLKQMACANRPSLRFDESHPVLLQANHVISKLVARNAHNRKRTLCVCRRKFLILRVKIWSRRWPKIVLPRLHFDGRPSSQ